MPWYEVWKALHLFGVVGFIGGVMVELVISCSLARAATVADARWAMRLIPWIPRIMKPALSTVLLGGIGLVIVGHWPLNTLWLDEAFVIVVGMSIYGSKWEADKLKTIKALAESDSAEERWDELVYLMRDPVIHGKTWFGVMFLFGLMYLMSSKPEFIGCVLALTIPFALGLSISSIITRRTERVT